MSESTPVASLLSELCSELGFCAASRELSRFESLVPLGAGRFTDAVLQAEGLDPHAEKQLRGQVRERVARLLNAPDADVLLANERQLTVLVCFKDRPRGRWTDLVDVGDLGTAVRIAVMEATRYAETGVLVRGQGEGRCIYWTSLAPYLYNSTVLQRA